MLNFALHAFEQCSKKLCNMLCCAHNYCNYATIHIKIAILKAPACYTLYYAMLQYSDLLSLLAL